MNSINPKRYKPYLPYIKEGLFCLVIDLVICFVGVIVFLWLGIAQINTWFLLVFPFYLLVECFLNYRIMWLSVFEVKMRLYVKERIQFTRIKRAPEFVGKWETILPKFYPNYKCIEKNILYYKRDDGSIIRLRCVFYGTEKGTNNKSFSVSESRIDGKEEVVYGRFSKVIISRRGGMTVTDCGMWNRALL